MGAEVFFAFEIALAVVSLAMAALVLNLWRRSEDTSTRLTFRFVQSVQELLDLEGVPEPIPELLKNTADRLQNRPIWPFSAMTDETELHQLYWRAEKVAGVTPILPEWGNPEKESIAGAKVREAIILAALIYSYRDIWAGWRFRRSLVALLAEGPRQISAPEAADLRYSRFAY